MALFGPLPTLRRQAPPSPGFSTTFAYLDELMRAGSAAQARIRGIARGDSQKVELSGGVFALEQAYETKPRPEGFFESHRKYIDVQVVIEGDEAMEVADVSRVIVRDPYDPERDLIAYRDIGDALRLRLGAGDAAIFFPADAHMPSLRTHAAPALVRKVVIKVPVA